MKKVLTISVLMLSSLIGTVNAQIEVKGVISFTHTQDSLRNIYGISTPDSLKEAVRIKEYAYQKSFDQEVTVSGNNLLITTDFEFPSYTTGMNLFVTVPVLSDTVNTPQFLQINSQIPVPIMTIAQDTITNIQMKAGVILIMVFDGNNFMVINTPVNKCPGGFKKMTDKYCIQINRNPLATFWNAHKDCNDQGYHLCTFQEWYYACVNNAGLVNLPMNFEWVHSSSNHNIHALKIGAGADCQMADSETTAVTGLPMYYRCCYHIR